MPVSYGTPLPATVPNRPRVLVVDDEPAIRTVARLMLEGAGYVVTEAGTAAAALARVESAERSFTVILLDVTLPDRAGTELLPDLRAASPRSRVMLTSGRPEESVPGHGADGFLAKPFTRDQLVAAMRSITAMTPT